MPLQYLQSADQASAHAIEGAGENRDFVLAIDGEFGNMQVAEAGLVGHGRKARYRSHDGEEQQQVEHGQTHQGDDAQTSSDS